MRILPWLQGSVLVIRTGGMVSDALVLEENFQMLFHAADCMTRCPMLLVEVIISLKCLGGCLLGTTSYAVARGKENSIALTTTDQSSHITLQLRKGCWSKAKTDQTLQAFIHMSFLLVMRSNNKNHNREKAPLKVAFQRFGTQLLHVPQWK